MTREEAGRKAKIMQAYADGKDIEYYDVISEQWVDKKEPSFDDKACHYRVKVDPKYRPFKDAKECWQEMLKHKPFGWIQSKNGETLDVWKVRPTGIMLYQSDCSFNCALNDYVFADGTPFGIKEEE